jgi:hypothetical protein
LCLSAFFFGSILYVNSNNNQRVYLIVEFLVDVREGVFCFCLFTALFIERR